jgi:hypothetical protein
MARHGVIGNFFIASRLIVPLALVVSCAEERNPYAAQSRMDLKETLSTEDENTSSEDNSIEAETPVTNGPKGGTQTPMVAPKLEQSLTDMLDAMCKTILSQNIDAKYLPEFNHLCTASGATTLAQTIVSKAYAGGSTIPSATKVKLASEGKQTELIAASAVKMPISLEQAESRRERLFGMKVTAEGVTNTFSLQQTLPAQSATVGKCYIFKQNVNTKVAIISMNDDIILKECDFHFKDKEPKVDYSIRDQVADDPANSDNFLTRQINIMMQTAAAETYGFAILHIIVDNKSMPGTAETKAWGQAPYFVKEYYSLLVNP